MAMKVLWLAPFPHPLETNGHPVPWVGALADLLSQRPEIELTILNWTHRIAEPVDEFDRNGIHFIYLRTPTVRHDILTLYQRRIRIMRAYLRAHCHRYDLLHLHGSELQLPAMTAGLPVPMLLSVQGIVSQYPRFVPDPFSILKGLWTMAGFYERRYLPAVPNFSCRTDWDKTVTARLSPKATIYHNWEALRPEFFAAADHLAPVPTPRPQALFVGGNQVMKGFKEMLIAFNEVHQIVDMQLVIVGRVAPADVMAVARQHGLTHLGPENVACRPFLDAAGLAALMRESFCLLHPSYIDNSPNSVCEAQLVGLPVVAANVGGVGSLITEGQTGLFCDRDPATLARQVLRLHHDPALHRRIARQAQALARQRHAPATIVQRTLDIYRAIVRPVEQPRSANVQVLMVA